MNYANLQLNLINFHKKSKKKYKDILKKYKDIFPSFLSTKHYYKKRKAIHDINLNLINFKHLNINSAKKTETNLVLSKIATKRNSLVSNNSKNNNSFSSINLDSKTKTPQLNKKTKNKQKKTSLSLTNNLREQTHKYQAKRKKLSISDKQELSSILSNFQKHKLLTQKLCQQEEKCPLNNLTESNYLFFFSNYKNRLSKKKGMKHLLYNQEEIDSMPNSCKVSLDMMKKFNKKANKIFAEEKLEGIKFSNNINEFRKQIINSYRDKFRMDDITQDKLNYDNALKLINRNQEKQIQKALELEKEFYMHKYNENINEFKNRDYLDGYIERKNKKPSTKKLTIYSFSSKENKNMMNLSKEKNIKSKGEEKRNEKENKSYTIRIKKGLLSSNQNIKSEFINTKSKNNNKLISNNLYLNYVKKFKKKKTSIQYEDLSTKKEYENYTQKSIRERSRLFADSISSINHYFEYQPLRNIKSDVPSHNINMINLKRVIKLNQIKKNLVYFDDDDLLQYNIKKLKDDLREVELNFYSIDKTEKKYHLSFLKNKIKPQTINKVNAIKNPRFGIPV